MHANNVQLAQNMNELWNKTASQAVTKHLLGESYEVVMREAMEAMLSEGLTSIQYASGIKTSPQAALRRHLVTQANQARNRLLLERMDEWHHDLVFTSAHFGSRPSHASWQGKVFSVSGTSKRYPSLVEKTGYGTAGGLCGVNCKHTMTPFIEGLSQLPNTDFENQERITGLSSDEYFKATQSQRRYERSIRQTKEHIALFKAGGLETAADEQRLRVLQAKLNEHCKANKLFRGYSRERAWGVGSMPLSIREHGIKIKKKMSRKDLVEQATIREKNIHTKKYTQKFKRTGENKATQEALHNFAVKALTRNSGTLREGMIYIDSRNGRVIWEKLTGDDDLAISAPYWVHEEIARINREAGREVIVSLHTHPLSSPPSPEDFVACARNNYKCAYVATSDGKLYKYTADSETLTVGLIVDRIKQTAGSLRLPQRHEKVTLEAVKLLSKEYRISCLEL